MMIYALAKVTIQNNNTATIDRPIIIYKGDKNIEIQFEIFESIFRQYKTEGPNTIENLGASYGQLLIKKPDYSCAVSEITETKNGHIVFVIPPEMTDDDIEVGAYSFHIRLFDETLNSRVTLPPVESGIIVAEAIANE